MWLCTLLAEDEALFHGSIMETAVELYIVQQIDATDKPEEIGVVLEGQIVLHELVNIALAAAM